jgi:DNA-binding transcriptional MerR regulator
VAAYGIGDLERFLGVRAHVIRYWEKEVPLIQPKKDSAGRWIYSKRDLLIFFRLKYLLYNRRFTLEGAREQLFRELTGTGEQPGLKAHLEALRSGLVELYFLVHGSAGGDEKPAPEDRDRS